MYKYILSISISTLLALQSSIACDCKSVSTLESLRKKSFELSDIVFLGELISTNDTVYTLKIIEIFKGSHRSDSISGKEYTSCSLFPLEKGKWIIYGNYSEESNFIDIESCLVSRSRTWPLSAACTGCYQIPPPPKPGVVPTESDKLKEESARNEILRKARADWDEEIELLRKK